MPNVSEDHLAIQAVIVNYAAGIDEQAWDAYRECFVPDVEMLGFSAEPMHGVETWVAFVEGVITRYRATQHLLGVPQITIAGDTATIRTPLQALHFPKEAGGEIFSLWGTYYTEVARTPDGWRMTQHRLDTSAVRHEKWED